MKEKAKRLKPTSEVLRELYLKSGNQCAFPGCCDAMVDENGNFTGQVCHIEAAEEGGERFNPNMTNEDRRAFGNLMLMCYKHHVITNDVNIYTVPVLQKMKKDHEDKFSNVIQKMKNSVVDYGIVKSYRKAITCQKFSDVLGSKCTEEENLENARVLNTLIDKLADVPIGTRSLLTIMVFRSFSDRAHNCIVPLHEVQAATGKEFDYILKHVEILNRRGILSEIYEDEYNCPFCNLYEDSDTLWDYWNDIREFCKRADIPLGRVCVDLDFSIFD